MKKILDLDKADGSLCSFAEKKTEETKPFLGVFNLKATLFYDPIQEREKCRDHNDQIDQTEFFLPRIHDFIFRQVPVYFFLNSCD